MLSPSFRRLPFRPADFRQADSAKSSGCVRCFSVFSYSIHDPIPAVCFRRKPETAAREIRCRAFNGSRISSAECFKEMMPLKPAGDIIRGSNRSASRKSLSPVKKVSTCGYSGSKNRPGFFVSDFLLFLHSLRWHTDNRNTQHHAGQKGIGSFTAFRYA